MEGSAARVIEEPEPPSARELYEEAKRYLNAGSAVVFGPEKGAVQAVLKQLRARSITLFDCTSYDEQLSKDEAALREFYKLLFEFPDVRFEVRIRYAIFLRGWRLDPMLVWKHDELDKLKRVLIEEGEEGIDFGKIK